VVPACATNTSTPHAATSAAQGLTLVHVSAQRKRFLWDRGCIYELFKGALWGTRGMLRVYLCQKRLRLS